MIAMMIIMILTNKEWCRFIANNVVQEPLSLKLPMCVLLAGVNCMCVCVYVCVGYCHLSLWLKIKADCLQHIDLSLESLYLSLCLEAGSSLLPLEESSPETLRGVEWMPEV